MTGTPLNDAADAQYLWHELATLRFEVAAAVSWIRSGAADSVALHRLDVAGDHAMGVLTQLESRYATGAS
jgi:hypothetical protein